MLKRFFRKLLRVEPERIIVPVKSDDIRKYEYSRAVEDLRDVEKRLMKLLEENEGRVNLTINSRAYDCVQIDRCRDAFLKEFLKKIPITGKP
jgi:hypothetical protein